LMPSFVRYPAHTHRQNDDQWSHHSTSIGRVIIKPTLWLKKTVHFCFCQNFCQISMNFNKFWYIDGKMAEIVCYNNNTTTYK